MMSTRTKQTLLLAGLLLIGLPGLRADLREDVLRLGASYSNRVQEIRTEGQTRETDLLRKFIIALVRVEQKYRDQGDLDGLVATKQLREDLIVAPRFPEAAPGQPEQLRSMIGTLKEHRQEIQRQTREEERSLNTKFSAALEPYQRELTREGDLDTALSVRDLRNSLETGHAPDAGDDGAQRPPHPVRAVNPASYPVLLEPAAFRGISGLTPRVPSLPLFPESEGNVTDTGKLWIFRNGVLRIPGDSIGDLVQQTRLNHQFTLELALHTDQAYQGRDLAPNPVLLFGTGMDAANFMVTQETTDLFLYLRTSEAPGALNLFKVNLGPLYPDRVQHFVVTYRNGELNVYANGDNRDRTYRDITGSLDTWTSGPFFAGGAPRGNGDTGYWKGKIIVCAFKPTEFTARQSVALFERFRQYVIHFGADEEGDHLGWR